MIFQKAFTLIELLIVIAILAILAASVVIVLNPSELMAQARDAERISSIESLKKSIDLFILDNPGASLGIPQRVYISLPSATAPSCDAVGLPALPLGWSYACSSSANLRKTDGTGWVPLNFGNIYGGSPVSSLPVDPINDVSSGKYYAYVMGGSYSLSALIESEKNFALKDGGRYVEMFEAGTNLSLLPVSRDPSLVGYWVFDGAGLISNGQTTGLIDSSGKGNNGVAINTDGAVMSFAQGKLGTGIVLDGINDAITIPHSASLMPSSLSISGWVNFSSSQSWMLVNKANGGISGSYYIYGGAGSGYWSIFGPTGARYDCYFGSWVVGSWYHFVGVFDASSGKSRCYTNGQLKGTVNGAALGSNTAVVYIGRYTSGYQTPGTIDDIRIYNRALSDSEVKAMYEIVR